MSLKSQATAFKLILAKLLKNRQEKARKPRFPGKFNREASRLGDVGSEDPGSGQAPNTR